jgi:hypothetical protein
MYKVYNHNRTCLGTFATEKEAIECMQKYMYETENPAYIERLINVK